MEIKKEETGYLIDTLPVVIYGGENSFGRAYRYLKETNKNIVAICNKFSMSEGIRWRDIPVLSKADVLKQYGDSFAVWISPSFPINYEIQWEILNEGFATEDRILNFISGAPEYYRSCPHLQGQLLLGDDRLITCCPVSDVRPNPPGTSFSGELTKECVDEFMNLKRSLIQSIREGTPCACDGCQEISWGVWSNELKIHNLTLWETLPCQLSCTYCNMKYNARNAKKHPEAWDWSAKSDIEKGFRLFEEGGYLAYDAIIDLLAAGEISIHPDRKRILNAVGKYDVQVLTNSVKYDDDIARVTSWPNSYIKVSIDCGTRETYQKIKGLDAFDQTVATLCKYSEAGVNIVLKYIVMDINSGEQDLEGFLDVCEKVKPRQVLISRNLLISSTNISEEILNTVAHLVKKLRARHICYVYENTWPKEIAHEVDLKADNAD